MAVLHLSENVSIFFNYISTMATFSVQARSAVSEILIQIEFS